MTVLSFIILFSVTVIIMGAGYLIGYMVGEDKSALRSADAYHKLSSAYEREKIEHQKLKRMIGDDAYRGPAAIEPEVVDDTPKKKSSLSPELLALMAGTALMLPMLGKSKTKRVTHGQRRKAHSKANATSPKKR